METLFPGKHWKNFFRKKTEKNVLVKKFFFYEKSLFTKMENICSFGKFFFLEKLVKIRQKKKIFLSFFNKKLFLYVNKK